MSSLDLDLDDQMSNLEFDWRQVYEASIVARADYQALAIDSECAEALKGRIMAKIERLEDHMLSQD
jgi:hypothetical protein